MNRRHGQRGSGRMGCIVFVALVGLTGFIGSKLVPPYLAKVEFAEQLDRVVSRSGATGKTAKQLGLEVERIADFHDFQIVPGSLKSTRKVPVSGPARLHVEVTCYRDIRFPGYRHRFQFTSKASTFVGSL